MADYQDNEQVDDVDQEEVEQEARALGWVPEEEFKGLKSKWVDAHAFVEKGRVIVPIMKQNNERLKKELLSRDQKIDTLVQQVQSLTASLEKLDGHYAAATKRQVAEAKRELIERLKTAREDNDVDAEEQIRDQLDELREADRKAEAESEEAKKKSETKKTEPQSNVTPEFQEWNKENPWFNDLTDPDNRLKTKQVSRIAEDLRDEGTKLKGREFLEEVMRLWDEQYGETQDQDEEEEEEEEEKPRSRRATSKVASSANRRSESGSAKSFASLPRDAQQACLDDAEALVGEGKRYKDLNEWKKDYARIYYGS